MAETVQVNVRVPEEARALILRLATRLRDDPSFPAALERFLDDLGPVDNGLTLTERVARLEAMVAELRGENGNPTR